MSTRATLETLLSQKLANTSTIMSSTELRQRELNNALIHDVGGFADWDELKNNIYRPLSFVLRGYLFCGQAGSTTYTDYTGITDAEFSVTIDGTARNITGINLSTATSMADIATLIQTAVRAVTSGTEVLTYQDDYFVINSGTTGSSSSVSVLSAVTGGSGTDISGASYINGLTGVAISKIISSANVPADYETMTRLYDPENDGGQSLEYDYVIPSNFPLERPYTWTLDEVLGVEKFMINNNETKTLIAQYEKKLIQMTAATSTTGLSSHFDDAIVYFAAARIIESKNINDGRVESYRRNGNKILDALYPRDKRESSRQIRRVRTSRSRGKLYSHNQKDTYRWQ